MNKNGFSAIFRCKEFAGSRAKKARGWFGSNMVSKFVLFFNCSFILGIFQLSTVNQQIAFAYVSARETCRSVLFNENFQSRRTVSKSQVNSLKSYLEFALNFRA